MNEDRITRMIDNFTAPKTIYHNPTLNPLNLSINRKFIEKLNLQGKAFQIIMEALFKMNSHNVLPKKELLHLAYRSTLKAILSDLQDIGVLFVRMDGNILINPKIGCLQRSRRNYGDLEKVWNGRKEIND